MHTSQSEWNADLLRTTLQEIRDRAGLTHADIGKLAGRDRTTASKWLHGKHQPDVEAVTRLTTALRASHPELGDLIDQFMQAAGYQVHASTDALIPPPHRIVEALREQARSRNQSLGELLVGEGLAHPDELIVPDALPPDPTIEEINASDISDETKATLIRLHLENRARRFEQERLKRAKPDGRN
ncbi:helix-turn-helix domain-containing protein [Nonomuraea wenchangensis]|uniref:helix-turn-helix domain-containing protein n=1 Tax=Nonomuraea wenchangensis TaxID=568860 RepID=UPI0015A7134D|nr:helix-turn-helix transcriptional regulator [Nonomuraea wenchangensis]